MKPVIPFIFAFAGLVSFATVPAAQEAPKKTAPPVVVMETNMGTMEITLNPDKAPLTVRNFLSYVNEGFYDKTIFHRVIFGFMIQGGGFTRGMSEKKARPSIKNEAANGLSNKRGTITMALTDEINSATSQFFINQKDNAFLDHKDNTPKGFGYAVFGEVTKGIEVVDKIAAVKTGAEDVPVKPVIILSVKIKK